MLIYTRGYLGLVDHRGLSRLSTFRIARANKDALEVLLAAGEANDPSEASRAVEEDQGRFPSNFIVNALNKF